MANPVALIDRFITPGSKLARAGGARMLLRVTGGNVAGAAALAAIAKKESEFGRTSGKYGNNLWGWGVHLGPSVYTSPTVEAGAAKVWKGLNSGLYRGAGINTLPAVIMKYAPPSENNTALYQQQVSSWLQQLGVSPNTNIFNGSGGTATTDARGAAPSTALPASLPAGQLDTRALMKLLSKTQEQVLRGQMPGDDYGAQLAKIAEGAYPRAQTVATTQQVGTRVVGAAQAVNFAGLKMGGGPDAHHSRALGNWQSDDAYDLMGKPHEAIPAMVSGVVTKISGTPGKGGGLTGYGITVRTANGDLFFKHLGTRAVKVGQRITPQTIIGTLDPTVNGGAHLHLGGNNRSFLDALAKVFTTRSAR